MSEIIVAASACDKKTTTRLISKVAVWGVSFVALWTLLVCMSFQGFVFLAGPFGSFLPIQIGAAWMGFWGATPILLFVPALWASTFGVIGLPTTWFDAIKELCLALEPEDSIIEIMTSINLQSSDSIEFARKALDTTLRVIVPFYSYFVPENSQGYPTHRRSWAYHSARTDECWIYINGIATDKAIAEQNCTKLNKLFHQPIYLVHNATHSILFDLMECVAGKLGLLGSSNKGAFIPPRNCLKQALKQHIRKENVKKVVLITHSQGTIITGNALAELAQEEGPAFLNKMKTVMEVYNFATCSHEMPNDCVNYMENIGNQNDTVAWLGMLFPFKSYWPDVNGNMIRIGGETIIQERQWGHLLNTHYLIPLQRNGHFYRESRLHKYLKHSTPGATAIQVSGVRKIE